MWNVLSTNVSRAVWAALVGACLPIVASAGTINIIISDSDVVYSGANFGGSIYDVVGHPGGNLNPAEADNVKTAVFEKDMASVGAIMSGDAGFGQMYVDLKIDNVGASINSNPVPPGANFHPGIGNNGGGFGLDWFTSVGGYKLQLGITSIDLLLSSSNFFFTGTATLIDQNLPFGLAFDPNQPIVFSYTATLPGLMGPIGARVGAMGSGALTISGTLIPEPTTIGLALVACSLAGLAAGRRRRAIA
jgi:hypothetical protein